MKIIIQNKHYFTTFLLTSEPKCNFKVTKPALNCNLLCLKQVADFFNILPELQLLGHSASLRGVIVADYFLANMAAAFSGLVL